MKKYCKVIDGVVVQTQRNKEKDFVECPESVSCGMVKVGAAYKQPDPIIKTPTEIDKEKDDVANSLMTNPALEAAIEEFSSILTAAGIGVPVDITANITDRIKGKLP